MVVTSTASPTSNVAWTRVVARKRPSVFRERYRKRSGIEATNSILKRKTGLGRVRVRGRPSVFHSILLKVAGWNLLQAARALAMRRSAKLQLLWGKRGGLRRFIARHPTSKREFRPPTTSLAPTTFGKPTQADVGK